MSQTRDREDLWQFIKLIVIGCQFLLEFFQIFLAFRHVHLIRHDNLRTFHQAKIIGFKLFIDLNIIFIRVASFTGRHINNMQDNSSALDVTKELGSESNTLASPFNQSRKVCYGKGFPRRSPNHSQIWNDGCEMISPNFWFG